LGNEYSKHNVIAVMTAREQQDSSIKLKSRLLLSFLFFLVHSVKEGSNFVYESQEKRGSQFQGECASFLKV